MIEVTKRVTPDRLVLADSAKGESAAVKRRVDRPKRTGKRLQRDQARS